MFVVDTNVLVYAANAASPEHARCRERLDSWRRSRTPWYVSWGILYEFLRIVTHPRVFADPWPARDAWAFVRALLASPGLQVLVATPRHADFVEQIVGDVPALKGNLLHDAHTAALMLEHGLRRIYTRDTDFTRFAFLEVLDPLAPEG